MKEIGGYFGLEDFPHNEYYSDLIAVNSARNALLYILKAREIRKLFIPSYLCDSISELCEREGYSYEYYSISENFQPEFNQQLQAGEYLYIVNYFGQISNEQVIWWKKRYKNVIIDNVQAFYQKPVEGVDTLYSCRKFFGVPDGGYVATEARLTEDISMDVSMERMKHILGRYEGEASLYYEDFAQNDERFYAIPLRKMSRLTHNILGAVDYEGVRRRREENYIFLHNHLKFKNPLKINVPVGPYAYPFFCQNGMQVKKSLAEKKIYIATLWPNAIQYGGIAQEYSENILPLPVDQRYSLEDMNCILEELWKCMRN